MPTPKPPCMATALRGDQPIGEVHVISFGLGTNDPEHGCPKDHG